MNTNIPIGRSQDLQQVDANHDSSVTSLVPLECSVSKLAKKAKMGADKETSSSYLESSPIKEKVSKITIQENLDSLETALKIQKQQGRNCEELSFAIEKLKKEFFCKQAKEEASSFLASAFELNSFNEILNIYAGEEDMISLCSIYLEAQEQPLPPSLHYLAALIAEHSQNWAQAVQHYVHLAIVHHSPLICLQKAEALLKNGPNYDWELRKDWSRMQFEKQLEKLKQFSSQKTNPTCFVCFNPEEREIGEWLEEEFVHDLDKMGIEPIFHYRDLNSKQEINNLPELADRTNLALIICTKSLAQKCQERKFSPTGAVQEVQVLRTRNADPLKYGLTFLAFPTTDHFASSISPFFSGILGVEFSTLDLSQKPSIIRDYFSAFELFGAMRQVSSEKTRELKRELLGSIANSLINEISLPKLSLWRRKHAINTGQALKRVKERVAGNISLTHLVLRTFSADNPDETSVKENSKTIKETKQITEKERKEIFYTQAKEKASLFLPSMMHVNAFIEIIDLYDKEKEAISLYSEYCLLQKDSPSLPDCYLNALIAEYHQNFVLAAKFYIELAKNHHSPLICLEKVEVLIDSALDDEKKLIKEEINYLFDMYLRKINTISPQKQSPTCFIAFDSTEIEIKKWVEKELIPNLNKVGIQSVFRRKETISTKMTKTDQAIIVCTPKLSKKCFENMYNPKGIVEEIHYLRARNEDPLNYESTFLLFPKGECFNSYPSAYFKGIVGSEFSALSASQKKSLFTDFFTALDLFGAMRKISREAFHQLKCEFLNDLDLLFPNESSFKR